MDSSPISILKAMLPKVPLVGKTTLYHALGLSEPSKHWDLRTSLIVNVLRSFIVDSPPESISKIQHISVKDPGIKGRIWVSKITLPIPPEDDIRKGLFKAIEALKQPEDAPGGYQEPDLHPLQAEWHGYRAGASKNSSPLKISEDQKYQEMMREVASPTTILYFHGGAYYLMDPGSHSLAPQNPFPAALLDALVAYFALLYPPQGSFHGAVEPRHIVFSGDSAGGNLCLALLQTILELRRQNLKIRWNGEDRDIPIPAGLALCSPWTDITHSSPSCETNAVYDYLPPPSRQTERMKYPECSIWPADPPRKNLYAEDAMLCHPLVSPLATKSWEGSCPLYIGIGTELLTDEGKYVAMRAARQGVAIRLEEYEAMPHCFALVLTSLPASSRFFTGWSDFIREVTTAPETKSTKGVFIKSKSLQEVPLQVTNLSSSTYEEVVERMRQRVQELGEANPDPMSKL